MIIALITTTKSWSEINQKIHDLAEQKIASFLISPYTFDDGVREIVTRCDGVVTDLNINKSDLENTNIYGWNDVIVKSHTEQNNPIQAKEFMRVLMKMYRTHLAKNADYSPANIQGPGMIGVATRMWDKMVRIMNLTGFDIAAKFQGFHGKKKATNEPYMDAFLDIAVYGVIAQLLEQDKWGK